MLVVVPDASEPWSHRLAGQAAAVTGIVRTSSELVGCPPPGVRLTCTLALDDTEDHNDTTFTPRLLHDVQIAASLAEDGYRFSLPLPCTLPPSIDAILKGRRLTVTYTLTATTIYNPWASHVAGAALGPTELTTEYKSPPHILRIPSVEHTPIPFSSDETLPLGNAGVISVGFSSPCSTHTSGQTLRLSLYIRNDSTVDIKNACLEISSYARVNSPVSYDDGHNPPSPALFEHRAVVQLVTFGRLLAGTSSVKRVPVHFLDSALPSVLTSDFEIEYTVQLSAVTATEKTCRVSSDSLQIVSSKDGWGVDGTFDVASDIANIEEWVAGISIANRRMSVMTGHSVATSMSIPSSSRKLSEGTSQKVHAIASTSESPTSMRDLNASVDQIYDGDWQQLEVDRWVSKNVAFQSTSLFYFDYEIDLTMTHPDDSDSDYSDQLSTSASHGHSQGTPVSNRALHKHGIPGVILLSNKAVGLRISKGPNRPNWLFYERTEESRCLLQDGSEEQICRFVDGPGRYYIAVYGKSIGTTSAQFEITVRSIRGLKDATPFHFLSFWIPFHSSLSESSTQMLLPPGAWQTGTDVDGAPLYTARVYYKGGLHIGKLARHTRGAIIPWGGKEITVDSDMEVLSQIPGSRWVKVLSGAGVPPDAIPGGYESDGKHLYIARAAIKESLLGAVSESGGWIPSILTDAFDGRSSICPGKAGAHMFGCNIAFGGREDDFKPAITEG
ncbi:hypothetical protein BASA50_003548 [Batrachochytrium salamandrivorans]|uniref:Arrestin C-terminal-like domain-containing protein n=1 Tax=Batrachochytrium salamandrivorans TaxID=1357716 RepID=A0ABQ8FIY7_9FUNG|nr:hypothetical protein BASA60_008217 [Batrachochytrium salamandrivorans]KAH6574901.1 hypothetical protein BASA62_002266 [Batrachochytrium salamandrivorans]KAH6592078.1 hypothetical protein BASA61_004714 [Batrachochytrium salamandrivorans]KAH6598509.1 hypothetical protein BASA50_003548 [Batrachochytrium salamandrivorans]